MPSTLLIRADASVQIGTGHIMRMIALGQEWQARGGEVVFACAEITPALRERLAQEGFTLKEIAAQPGSAGDLSATCALICQSEEKNPVVALDGYQFDADFQLGLKKAGCRLFLMDDHGHADFYHADWVLNQNISAREELYRNRAPQTHLLLGPKYALLRKEFLKYRGWKCEIPDVARKVLVTLGGADPENVTQRVIEVMAGLDLEVKVVVGGSNPHLPSLCQAVENLKSSPARIELVVNPSNMPELMIWADLAVAAGGSTSLELAFFSLPALFFVLAENQREIALNIEKNALGLLFGSRCEHLDKTFAMQVQKLISDSRLRGKMSATAAHMVDGLGSERVFKRLQ
jgi:UDP-2,4-diacetamido-2,4,6-trideoxy-beta-L-altropyranose hydrolase